MENNTAGTLYPDDDSGLQCLYDAYGDPRARGWGRQWLLTWKVQQDLSWFPAQQIHIHKAFQPRLFRAFHHLERLGLHQEITPFNEGFNIRFINGSDSVLSAHSWGAAIDLNAEENPLGSAGKWSKGFIDVMVSNGVYCGQNWVGRKDPMHFSLVNG